MHCFSFLKIITLVLLFPFDKKWSTAQTINCNASNSCDDLTAVCDSSKTPCQVNCDGNNCAGLTVDCATNSKPCQVVCGGGADACVDLEINCAPGESCSVNCTSADTCTGEISFTGSAIIDYKGPQVYCQASGSCSAGTFNAPDRNFFGLSCEAANACDGTIIDCGITQNCNLNCDFVPESCLNTVQDCSSVINICNKDCCFGCDMVDQICTPTDSRSCTSKSDLAATTTVASTTRGQSAATTKTSALATTTKKTTSTSATTSTTAPPPTSDKTQSISSDSEQEESQPTSSPLDKDRQNVAQVSSLRSTPSKNFGSTTGGKAVYGVAGLVGIAIVAIAVALVRRKRLANDPNEQINDEQVLEGAAKTEIE